MVGQHSGLVDLREPPPTPCPLDKTCLKFAIFAALSVCFSIYFIQSNEVSPPAPWTFAVFSSSLALL